MPVSLPLALAEPPQRLWRVEREDPPLCFSRINAVDAVRDRSGNRFDVAGAGVLYAATEQEGAYAETLAAFRPSASLIARLEAAGMDPGLPGPGEVPRSWRLDRQLRALTLSNPLPFVNIDAPSTHTYLTRNAARLLTELGVNSLDVATVRGPHRFLTRSLATGLYAQTDARAASTSVFLATLITAAATVVAAIATPRHVRRTHARTPEIRLAGHWQRCRNRGFAQELEAQRARCLHVLAGNVPGILHPSLADCLGERRMLVQGVFPPMSDSQRRMRSVDRMGGQSLEQVFEHPVVGG